MNAPNLFPRQLDGCTVPIVGGTSGIGLSTAIQANSAGAEVVVLGSNRERANAVASQYGLAGWRAADVTQPEAIAAALSDIPEQVGHMRKIFVTIGLP